MNIAFIGCMVMAREISYEASKSGNVCRTWWLRQGLHDTPRLLKKELQRIINEIEAENNRLNEEKSFDYICLGYGMCSDSVSGLKAGSVPIVVPKCDDCISLFLGSSDRYHYLLEKYPGTYWYNPGWIEHGFTPSKESYEKRYEEYVHTYGKDNAEFLMEAEGGWKDAYNSCIYIKSPVYDKAEYQEYAKKAAEHFGMDFIFEKGSMNMFHKLLNGPWNEKEFLICPAKHIIHRVYDDRKLVAAQGLDQWIKEREINVDFPCGGNHTCGKCKVRIEGDLSDITKEERAFLSEKEIEEGYRLACFCKVYGKVSLKPEEPELQIISLREIPEVESTRKGTGVVCDIGTTTLAVQIYDCQKKKLLAEQMEKNQQCVYGADVISRITSWNNGNSDAISSIIKKQIERMIRSSMDDCGTEKIDFAVVTGNTTMLHLLESVDPRSIAVAPYRAESLFGRVSQWSPWGAKVYIPPCIGAFTGADLVCAVLASGMTEKEETSVLIDAGTNGEMALIHNGEIICCSTAAGAAFEGEGIHMGMAAKRGAVCDVRIQDGKIVYDTVGGAEAAGICGSGIIDAISVLKDFGLMDETGFLEEKFTIPGSGVEIMQEDIRQVQLAKAAVCAGIYSLTNAAKVDMSRIDRFYVAGGFGAHINMRSAVNIGLFPREMENKTVFLGNGALGGALMLLLNDTLWKKAEDIAKSAREINLSTDAFFTDKYIECMLFNVFE